MYSPAEFDSDLSEDDPYAERSGATVLDTVVRRADVCRFRHDLHRQHADGAAAKLVTAQWADFVDHVVCRVMTSLVDDSAVVCLVDQFAVVATGGLGRRESSPYSDVDLMLLYQSEYGPDITRLMQQFVPALFDCGLHLSHCARTIEESALMAVTDPATRTAFAGCRLVFGSRKLFDELVHTVDELVGPDRPEFAREVLRLRLEERREFCPPRRDGTYNLKLSPGGLRDVQALGWAAWLLTGKPRCDALSLWWPPAGSGNSKMSDVSRTEAMFWQVVGHRLELHFHHRTNNDFFPGGGLSSLALHRRMKYDQLITTMQSLSNAFEKIAATILEGINRGWNDTQENSLGYP